MVIRLARHTKSEYGSVAFNIQQRPTPQKQRYDMNDLERKITERKQEMFVAYKDQVDLTGKSAAKQIKAEICWEVEHAS